jgi:two-component system, CitB family, cit operon sensor histidine kinase CitA
LNWIRAVLARAWALSFEVRLFFLLFVVSSVLLAVVGSYVSLRMENALYEQVGLRAKVQAREIAAQNDLVRAVMDNNLAEIASISQRISMRSDASYVVIGDHLAHHLYHPDPRVAVGSPMQGDDNNDVLAGRSSLTINTGSLGTALRGKSPIVAPDGQVIGIVSVGYLQDDIFRYHVTQRGSVVFFLILVLVALFACAWLFSKSIKRQMLNLEPIDIARMVRQQEAVFESIMEGVVAVDRRFCVTAINRAAREILDEPRGSQEIIGHRFNDLVECELFGNTEADSKEIRDEILLFRSIQVIANRVAIQDSKGIVGWVISFRRKDEINTLSLQLSEIKRYADNLRVLRHEHMNWISTLSGLLEMRYYDEALRLAKMQSQTQQRVLDYISATFANPQICGLLLGKYYRARELGLELVFDPGCQLSELPDKLVISEWMSIIGNLLDNAFEATLSVAERGRNEKVTLFLADSSSEIIIEVADNGCGVSADVRHQVFERGVSSKQGGERGIGLYLVKTYVEQAGGAITIDDNEPKGTVFSVFIPKGVDSANV